MYTPTQRLMRSRTDKVISGVAGGIAQYLAVDPVIVRLGFIALVFTGVGVLLYPVLWLIMPLEGSSRAAPEQAFDEMRQQAERVGDEVREVFVSPDSTPRTPRYDSMTGQPIEPEAEIPINNVQSGSTTPDPTVNRNQQLGIMLIGIGVLVVLSILFGPVFGKILFPLLLVGAGILVLRRSS